MGKKNIKKRSIETTDVERYDEEPYFRLLDLYFESNEQILVQHHIDSFNQFIEEIIPSIINGKNIIYSETTDTEIIKYYLLFSNYGIKPPSMNNDETLVYPLDAIQKHISYVSKYIVTVQQYREVVNISTGDTVTDLIAEEHNVPIAKIPIMVGSKYCNLKLRPEGVGVHCRYDRGGQFIINGGEKAIRSVEEKGKCKPIVQIKKEQQNPIYIVRVDSHAPEQYVGNTQKFSIKIKKNGAIVVVVSRFKEVSVFTFMRALGIERDEDIVALIADSKYDQKIINQLSIAMNIPGVPAITSERAVDIMVNNMITSKIYSTSDPEIKKQQKRAHLEKIFSTEILPHITSGTDDPELEMLYKAYYIGYMVRKLLKCYIYGDSNISDLRGCDDRDSMINKHIEVSGTLLGSIFEQCFKKMINDCSKNFRSKSTNHKKPTNIIPHIKSNTIEQGLRQALATGQFGSGNSAKSGIAQSLQRSNYLGTLSQLRRVVIPSVDSSTSGLTSIRHLHASQYGSLCPLETPEGANTGLVKNLAMMAYITVNMNSQYYIVSKYLRDKIITLDNLNKKKLHRYTKVFINHSWIGVVDNAFVLRDELRKKRSNGEIDKMVSIYVDYQNKEFHVNTNGGRLIRPYLTVTNNTLNFKPEMLDNVKSWDEFLTKYPGVIEYLDKYEEQNMMLAAYPTDIERSRRTMNNIHGKSQKEIDRINMVNRYDGNVFQRYTHCEIHPTMIFGVISSNIPFAANNQSVRCIFQYNQARHSMGIYSSDYRHRMDISNILYHSQIPLVEPRTAKYTGSNIFPTGENVIAAIASYTGYNQEDSQVQNNSAIEKGLFRAHTIKKHYEQIKKNQMSAETGKFMKPYSTRVDGMKKDVNYDKLNEQGYVEQETYIEKGDAYIGIVNPKIDIGDDGKEYYDSSETYKSLAPGAIDKVITGTNNDGYPIMNIRIRSERIPAIGDKYSCYDDKTEILTNKGWIKFSELDTSFMVATLTKDNRLLYEKPIDIMSYKISDKLYQVHTSDVDLAVTMNHDMWVTMYSDESRTWHKSKARHIIGTPVYYQKSSRYYAAPDVNTIDINGLQLITDDWIDLFSICYRYSGRIVDSLDILTLSPEIFVKLHKLCDKLGLTYVSNDYCCTIKSDKLLEFFRHQLNNSHPFGGWIYQLGRRQSAKLFDLFYGDTYILPDNDTYRHIHDQMQILAIHAGYQYDISQEQHHLNVKCVRKATHRGFISSNPVNIDHNSDSTVDYDGYVYCCQVSSGLLCVRRNGIPVFCGNSRHGQKGTSGAQLHRADMPFTIDGLQPDLIINPNCIPKRMTIGQLIECLLSKLCAVMGVFGDATSFIRTDIKEVNKKLVELGYSEWGADTMYNGFTGQEMEHKIFIGPTFYQRLKQMTVDKIHARSRGPTNALTRQPTDGRARAGGLRVGEMERDALIAHGMAQFLKEKMVDNSDIYTIRVCDLCGIIASKEPRTKYYVCKGCNNSTRVTKLVVPYCFKLLLQELKSINILGRIRTNNSIN